LPLVEVDGRYADHSRGPSLPEAGEPMRSLGAVEAMNLDGGGSSTTVAGGRLVNTPSDATGRRAVGDAVVVLPGESARRARGPAGAPAPAGRTTRRTRPAP
jgi:exopolysaccharide biosynthesis protein